MMRTQNGIAPRTLLVGGLLCSIIIGALNGAIAVNEDAYSFPQNNCGGVIQENDPLAQVRKNILINVVTVHSAARHRVEFTTCINASTPDGRTMYAAASCTDPTSNVCDQCLREAQMFEDQNCLYHDQGNAVENAGTCTIAFGTQQSVCQGLIN
ncbi:hypothetical protein LINGRAPRIM_LOCUS2797 [Linum grandiflorum]